MNDADRTGGAARLDRRGLIGRSAVGVAALGVAGSVAGRHGVHAAGDDPA